ncbi:MAG: rRNA maturation RNase YbeY [Xanthomonadales bacterium]|nr:rRNA maturation RNase YbeY [Xanthomonadales bacterium]
MSPKTTHEITVQRGSRAAHVPGDAQFRRWATAALAGGEHAWQLNIRVVGEQIGRRLNARYRKRDGATNVLSFRSDLPDAVAAALERETGVRPLGDLVICAPVVRAEAGCQGKAVADHWAHMVVHGVLHLQGFDHQQEGEAERMEAREIDILGRLGVADPYRQGPGSRGKS